MTADQRTGGVETVGKKKEKRAWGVFRDNGNIAQDGCVGRAPYLILPTIEQAQGMCFNDETVRPVKVIWEDD